MKMKSLLALVLFFGCTVFLPLKVLAQPFTLVAPNPIPGWNAANTADVLRFNFKKHGPLKPIDLIPRSLLNDPAYVAFNARGELFVGNRHGNVLNGQGSISRFTFDSKGNFFANGVITGNSLEAVHGLAFFPTGELFVANVANGLISRFLFDAGGNAIANGTFATGQQFNNGIAFSPNGELFTTTGNDGIVRRWTFNPTTGAVISNGSFTIPTATRLHQLTFNTDGELFVADLGTDRVFRLLFDDRGNPVDNGNIGVPGGPNGVAFSALGELFVTSHFTGQIWRFLFDDAGSAIPNGFTQTADTLGGVAIWGPTKVRGKPR